MTKGKLNVNSTGTYVEFYCPGCKETHGLNIGEGHPRWNFNEDFELPTFSPSVLVTSGHYYPDYKNTPAGKLGHCWCNFKERYPDKGEPPFKCHRCHSFIREGKIQFLSDCSHELAGMTVDLPNIPNVERSDAK